MVKKVEEETYGSGNHQNSGRRRHVLYVHPYAHILQYFGRFLEFRIPLYQIPAGNGHGVNSGRRQVMCLVICVWFPFGTDPFDVTEPDEDKENVEKQYCYFCPDLPKRKRGSFWCPTCPQP